MSPHTERPAAERVVTVPPAGDGRDGRRRDGEPTRERQVHEPHRVGLPPIGAYVADLWRRREFAFEMSRTDLRAQHFNTFFGQLWLVINPLLLACVYFILVDILHAGSRGTDFFAHLMAGLFAYHFVSDAVRQGAKSVVAGGRLILNTAFPRALLPLSSVMTAFMRFVPTIAIYAPVHVASGLPIDATLLWVVPIVALLALLASGVAMLVAAAQVYFRDISSFLPYVLRIWLYASPVLYYAHEVPERYGVILDVNPIAPLLTALSEVLSQGEVPAAGVLGLGLVWAAGIFVVGALFFVSREREFAVRL
jgi:teichoic acid transport system permease protein